MKNTLSNFLDIIFTTTFKNDVGYTRDQWLSIQINSKTKYFLELIDILNSNDKLYLLHNLKKYDKNIGYWDGLMYWASVYKLNVYNDNDKLAYEIEKHYI
jgi:hypothetical protein